jgi:hypothetical protein
MTLALIPPSSGRSRVQAAAAHLQSALDELRLAAIEQAAQDARRADRLARDETARAALVRSRAALDGFMVRIDRRWLEKFGAALEDAAHEAQRGGERSHARQLGDLVASLAAKLKESAK